MDSRTSATIHGVNLGGWLVLEKWITPSVFAGTNARDEYSLCAELGGEKYQRLIAHRDSFVTERDFEWLASHGIGAVRIPIGYWIFGDAEPFVPAVMWLDQAFMWAESLGMKILVDLHAAPGSQNGKDHSGRIGPIEWPESPTYQARSLQLIDWLATRYKASPALLGIELLNEPSSHIKKKTLLQYYQAAHTLIRRQVGPEVLVLMSDAFKTKKYARALGRKKLSGGVLDTHLYQLFSAHDKHLTVGGHLQKTSGEWANLIANTSKKLPMIIGEWSIALDSASLEHLSEYERNVGLRAYGAAQLATFEKTAGWFYWTYKTESGGAWSFRDSVEKGLLPSRF